MQLWSESKREINQEERDTEGRRDIIRKEEEETLLEKVEKGETRKRWR